MTALTSTPNQISGYRILAKIGEGAASTLYAVQDAKTKQVSALKHVVRNEDKDERFLEQCEQEYIVGSRLDHASVRGVRRLIKHRRIFQVQAVSLVMELIDAETLESRISRGTKVPHTTLVRIFSQIADGLAHMHDRGYVHADIKPNNVLVDEHDRAKIIDLGQACKVGTVKPRIQGTPGYMAPEQAHRQAITPRTDIYNLGATMYWVLVRDVIPTALPPKADQNGLYTGALDAEQVEPPVPPHVRDASIHPLLSKQILECVKLRPEDRPESMNAVKHRLDLIAELLEAPSDDLAPDNEDTVF